MPLEHAPDWRTNPPKGCDPLVWCGALARAQAVHRSDPYPTQHDVYEATIIVNALRAKLAREYPKPAICKPSLADIPRVYKFD